MNDVRDVSATVHSLIGEIKAGHAYLAEVHAAPLPPCRCSSFALQYEGVCQCEAGRERRRREHLVATRQEADLLALPTLLALAEAGLALREAIAGEADEHPRSCICTYCKWARAYDAAVKAALEGTDA